MRPKERRETGDQDLFRSLRRDCHLDNNLTSSRVQNRIKDPGCAVSFGWLQPLGSLVGDQPKLKK